ncbi:hypothetical protein [Zavarzinella formosa]|uniref:hypothetical protein n=1 Tax=Zavarzinella formosa TaxID=360055 RepID=UPI000307B81F|nr:hypothetical protein [Zavarzinella formosa]
MTRYSYPVSRKHHAYSMAIDFGMKFVTRNGFWSPEGLMGITGSGGYRIVVADESHPLMQPRVGDIIRWISSCGEPWEELHHRVVAHGSPDLHLYDIDAAKRTLAKAVLQSSISERNSIPFHWPDCEPL